MNKLLAAGLQEFREFQPTPGGDGGTDGTGVADVDKNSTVHIHRGVIGDTDNPQGEGGISDLDSTIHRWLNPVAEIVIRRTFDTPVNGFSCN